MKGNNIILRAYDDDMTLQIVGSSGDADHDAIVPVNEIIPAAEDVSFGISIIDPLSNVYIKVEKGASIIAGGSIVMTAGVDQRNGFIPFAEGINPVTVKVGNAKIVLDGTISAGGSFSAKTELNGAVKVNNAILAKAFIPVAVNVAVSESGIRVGESGTITAEGSVSLSAGLTLNIMTRSTTGALPISLAVSVVVADAYVETLGDITAKTGSILMDASANRR